MSEVAMDQNNMFLRICFYIGIYYKVIKNNFNNHQFLFHIKKLIVRRVSNFFDDLG